MIDNIKNALEKMRPYLNSHGGDFEFISYEDGVVFIKLSGLCSNCPHQSETLQNGLLKALQAEVPEVTNLIHVDL